MDTVGTHDIFLEPGKLFFGVGEGNVKIKTILGSCVAVTLWNAANRLGAMCHFVLPARMTREDGLQDPRYGNEAIAILVQNIRRSGVPIGDFRAGIFGGGNMFPRLVPDSEDKVGNKNIRLAKTLVARTGLTVYMEDTGGVFQRYVTLQLSTGEVTLRKQQMR